MWVLFQNRFHPVVHRFSHKWCPQFLAPMKLSRIDDWSVQRSISADGTGGGQGGYLPPPPLHILAEPLTLFKPGWRGRLCSPPHYLPRQIFRPSTGHASVWLNSSERKSLFIFRITMVILNRNCLIFFDFSFINFYLNAFWNLQFW